MATEIEEFFLLNKEFVEKWQEFFDAHADKKIEFGQHLRYEYEPGNGWGRTPGITHIYVNEYGSGPVHHWIRDYTTALCGVGKAQSYRFECSDTVPADNPKGFCPRCEQRMRGFIKRNKKNA